MGAIKFLCSRGEAVSGVSRRSHDVCYALLSERDEDTVSSDERVRKTASNFLLCYGMAESL